jgi:hypothetical protein
VPDEDEGQSRAIGVAFANSEGLQLAFGGPRGWGVWVMRDEGEKGVGCWWCGRNGRETGGGFGVEGTTQLREGVGPGPNRRAMLCEQGCTVL